MGLKIHKKLWNEYDGYLDSIYCRIEQFIYNKVTGRLSYTLQFYSTEEGKVATYPYYFEDIPLSASAVLPVKMYEVTDESVSGSIEIEENIYGNEIELPLYGEHYLTSSVEITDESGSITTKTYLDDESLNTDGIYPYMYNIVSNELSNYFVSCSIDNID